MNKIARGFVKLTSAVGAVVVRFIVAVCTLLGFLVTYGIWGARGGEIFVAGLLLIILVKIGKRCSKTEKGS